MGSQRSEWSVMYNGVMGKCCSYDERFSLREPIYFSTSSCLISVWISNIHYKKDLESYEKYHIKHALTKLKHTYSRVFQWGYLHSLKRPILFIIIIYLLEINKTIQFGNGLGIQPVLVRFQQYFEQDNIQTFENRLSTKSG